MEARTIAAVAVVVLAAIVAAFVLSQPPSPPPAPVQDRGEEVEYIDYFIENAAAADDVHIVMDLRGSEGAIRSNIMQCGIDLSAGSGLVSKTLHIYSLEGDVCTTKDGEVPVSECIGRIQEVRTAPGHVIFYVEKGDWYRIYEQELLIGVNESYQYKDCSVNLVEISTVPDGPEENMTLPMGPGPEITPRNESAANESG